MTRAAEQARPLVEALAQSGHEAVVLPLIEIRPLGDEPLDTSGYDWVVVTSANGARELARRRSGRLARVAAVGPATGDALRAAGIEPDVVAATPSQEGLLEALPRPPGRILFAGAEGARRLLPDTLGADVVSLYRTVELEPRPEDVPDVDVAVVASPSAARALAAVRRDVPVVSAGPQTSREARERGLTVAAEAERPDPESLVAAISRLPPA